MIESDLPPVAVDRPAARRRAAWPAPAPSTPRRRPGSARRRGSCAWGPAPAPTRRGRRSPPPAHRRSGSRTASPARRAPRGLRARSAAPRPVPWRAGSTATSPTSPTSCACPSICRKRRRTAACATTCPSARPTSRSSGRALDQLCAPPSVRERGNARASRRPSAAWSSTSSSPDRRPLSCAAHRACCSGPSSSVGVTCTTIRRAHCGQKRGGSYARCAWQAGCSPGCPQRSQYGAFTASR